MCRSIGFNDPEAIANWPHTLSRDGARTPMPWNADQPNFGFSDGTPWLPCDESHRSLSVDRQIGEPSSILNFTRDCLKLRREFEALRSGSIRIVEAGPQLLQFERACNSELLVCTFNLSDRSVGWAGRRGKVLLAAGDVDGGSLGAWSGIIEKLDCR